MATRIRPSPGTNHGKENIDILENPALSNSPNPSNSANRSKPLSLCEVKSAILPLSDLSDSV